MSNLKRLGANIRSLRTAYGETQEQLGEALFVEKNTVSYYENGKREPNKETLHAIAKHYMVSIEDLLHGDLTSIGKITVDKDALWKNIEIVLPLVSSEEALKNESFKKAFDVHKAFYDELHRVSLDGIDKVADICVDGYLEAIKNEEIEAEAAANFLALWYLMMASIKTVPMVMKNQPAALKQVAARDEKARKVIENTDPSFETDAKEILSEIEDDETEELISDMLIAVKRSKEWSDLADYYLALQYVWGIVKNDSDWIFNQRVGAEMMNALLSVKNIYAARFLKYSLDSFRGSSSQSVDDTE